MIVRDRIRLKPRLRVGRFILSRTVRHEGLHPFLS
jgi:hypothetical protein